MRHIFLIPMLLFTFVLQAQQVFTVSEALAHVQKNHPSIRAAMLQQAQAEALQIAAVDVPKTELSVMKGQYNSANKNDNNLTITQTLPFPTLWHTQHKTAKALTQVSEAQIKVQVNEISARLLFLIQQQLFFRSQQQLLFKQDSLFSQLVKAFEIRHLSGEGTLLEKTAILSQHHELKNMVIQNEVEINSSAHQLQVFLQTEQPVFINSPFEPLPTVEISPIDLSKNPVAVLQSRKTQVAVMEHRVSRNSMLPDLSIGYFNQTLIGYQTIDGQDQYFDSSNRFHGFTVGISVPLWFPGYTGANKAARLQHEAAIQQELAQQQELQQSYQLAIQDFNRSKKNLEYYVTSALPNATLLEAQSLAAFRHGEVDYATFILNLQQVLRLNQNYLQAILAYNQSVLTLNQLQGNL